MSSSAMRKLSSNTCLGVTGLIPQYPPLELAQGVELLSQLFQRLVNLGVGKVGEGLGLGKEVAQADDFDCFLCLRLRVTQLSEPAQRARLKRGEQFKIVFQGRERRARQPVRGRV